VPKDTDIGALAAYYSTVARGLAVQARDGASRERLAEIGRLAMNAWPGGKEAAETARKAGKKAANKAGKKIVIKSAKASGRAKSVKAGSC
jgi:hypothetical protein